MKLVEITDRTAWDEFVANSPWGHPLQLWGWGETKQLGDWKPYRLVLMDKGTMLAGVQVLLWQLPKLPYVIVYAPRGPVAEPSSVVARQLLRELVGWAKAHGALYVRIEPAWTSGAPKGWLSAHNKLQMSATYTIDLAKSDDDLLAPMTRKHRQYIRKAERDGIVVKRLKEGDTGSIYQIYVDTAKRAGFGIHSEAYYHSLAEELGNANYIFEAYYEGKAVAFLWLAAAGKTAYELYGGVTELGAEMKANYTLKWQAIQAMKEDGYLIYDFNGRLNEGVSRFKDVFGPDETDYIGTYDYPLNRLGYRMWESLWPVAKKIGRGWRGR